MRMLQAPPDSLPEVHPRGRGTRRTAHPPAPPTLSQVRQLQDLLPGMGGALRRMKPAELVRMAAQLEEVGRG